VNPHFSAYFCAPLLADSKNALPVSLGINVTVMSFAFAEPEDDDELLDELLFVLPDELHPTSIETAIAKTRIKASTLFIINSSCFIFYF